MFNSYFVNVNYPAKKKINGFALPVFVGGLECWPLNAS